MRQRKEDKILDTWFLGIKLVAVGAVMWMLYLFSTSGFAQTALDANAEATYDWATKYTFSGSTKTFSWCQPEAADPWTIWADLTYDLEIVHFQRDQTWRITGIRALSYNWVIPRTGHYIARVRAVTSQGASDWTVSTNDSVGDGICGAGTGWWIFAWVAPAGPPVEVP